MVSLGLMLAGSFYTCISEFVFDFPKMRQKLS